MTDINNVELNVGDKVVYTMITYPALKYGIITRLGCSYILIKYDYKSWDNKDKTVEQRIRSTEKLVMKL